MRKSRLRRYVIKRLTSCPRGYVQLFLLCLMVELFLVMLLLQGYYIDIGVWIHSGRDDIWIKPIERMYQKVPLEGNIKAMAPLAPTPPDVALSFTNVTPGKIPSAESITIAIGCAVTSLGTGSLMETEANFRVNLPFFSIMLPSFCATTTALFQYHFYVAYDRNDTAFSSTSGQYLFRAVFSDIIVRRCPIHSRVELHLVRCHHVRRPAWAQNDAMMEAYLDNRDYFYRINDDTVMRTGGWAEKFIYYLQTQDPPNVGVVGPNHKGGNDWILTYDFVHRTHVDIFGFYYPRMFTDWYGDGWITNVYLPGRAGKVYDVVLYHETTLGQRYLEDRQKLPWKEIMIRRGQGVLDR